MATWNGRKTVTLLWDAAGDCWRDEVTGVKVTGIAAPAVNPMGIPADYHGSGSYLDAPSQPSVYDAYEQRIFELIDRYLRGTGPDDDMLVKLIDARLAKRTIPDHPMYFMEGDWLITYSYFAEMWNAEAEDRHRLYDMYMQLTRPWWKRWFSR